MTFRGIPVAFLAAILVTLTVAVLAIVWDAQLGRAAIPKSARYCSSCHGDLKREWEASSMARSWKNPVFQAFLADARKALGDRADVECAPCHAPLAFVTGDRPVSDAVNQEGVTCNFCHNVSEVEVSPKPASYTWDPSDPDLMRGPYRDSDSEPTHRSVHHETFTRGEFCASCHWYERGAALPIETTHPRWKSSKAAASGQQCQHCHMTPRSGKAALISKHTREKVWSHHFAGAFTAGMLDSAASLDTAVEGGRLKLVVTNRRGGHSLPGGGGSFRAVTLEVVFRDAAGKETGRALVQTYGIEFADSTGTSPAPKWLARSVVRSVEIPADEPRVEWAEIPSGSKRAEAVLTYHFLFPAYVPALEARQVDLSRHRPKVLARAEAAIR